MVVIMLILCSMWYS